MDLVKTSENQSSTPLSSAESKTRRRPPLGLVLILLSTAVLGVIAVVSAFRLYQSKEEPIAPTAPEKTSAQEASSCILRFAVPEPTPTPTPTNTPTLTPTPSPTNTPTPTPTNTPTPEPTPTPVPECWDTCSNHSQCPSGLNCLSGRCANPSCSTEPSCTCPTPTPTPTPTPVYSLQCVEVKMYDYGWNQIFDFTTLRPQDVVHLTVRGETDHPQGLTMARFKINNGAWQETTDIRNGEFHIEYQISSSGEHVIEAQVYNSVFGWK